MPKIERFFVEYEKGANSFDVDLVTSEFTPAFMGADPSGVGCVHEKFRAAISARRLFFEQIGFKSAEVIGVCSIPGSGPKVATPCPRFVVTPVSSP